MESDGLDPFKLGELYKSLTNLVYRFLTYRPGDLKPCNTRIYRGERGLPFAKRLLVHATMDGRIGVKKLKADDPDPKQLGEAV